MSKYAYAKSAIEVAVADGQQDGLDRGEMLLALLVSAVEEYKNAAGTDEARAALVYELDNLGGNVDTAFLRSR